jgi:dolichyl-phosphate-mannose--protein O-mannosyl transferase
VPRIAFIYHFFPILPFVMLTLVYAWKVLLEQGWPKSCLYGYLVMAAVLFLMFYPAVPGLVVPEDYIRFLRWFGTWVF